WQREQHVQLDRKLRGDVELHGVDPQRRRLRSLQQVRADAHPQPSANADHTGHVRRRHTCSAAATSAEAERGAVCAHEPQPCAAKAGCCRGDAQEPSDEEAPKPELDDRTACKVVLQLQ
ncbi:hypothetical protein AAVH_41297, partial [Aphelenchoides avenae]